MEWKPGFAISELSQDKIKHLMSSLFDCVTFKQKQQRHQTVCRSAVFKSQECVDCHSVFIDTTTKVGRFQTLFTVLYSGFNKSLNVSFQSISPLKLRQKRSRRFKAKLLFVWTTRTAAIR